MGILERLKHLKIMLIKLRKSNQTNMWKMSCISVFLHFIFFRMEANSVLQEAIQVREELQKTKEAQKSAEAAIDEARGHISAADNDLKQVLTGCSFPLRKLYIKCKLYNLYTAFIFP